MSTEPHSPEQHRKVRPWVWMFLNVPFGVTSGFVAVMIGSLLKDQGAPDSVLASLVALNLLPHTWKFFWAPIADATLTRKRWYVLGNVASCATILSLAFIPIKTGNVNVIEWLIFLNSLAITFVGMSVEGLMAHATTEADRGRAAGWFQAGNLGGSGVGGGVGLILAEHISSRFALIAIGVTLGACTLFLFFVPEAPRLIAEGVTKVGSLGQRFTKGIARLGRMLWEVVRELWSMIATRRGIVAIALCFMPIGSAAAVGIFAGDISTQWHASPDLVAWMVGIFGGLASAIGCFVGGLASDKLGRRLAYALAGVLMALIAVGMAVSPRTPTMFAIWSLLYQWGGGVAYGAFTGFVLDVIGKGAAATKYNMLASLSNMPIRWITQIDGWASVKYGPAIMLFVDAGTEIAGICIFILVLAIVRPGKEKLPVSEPEPADLPQAKVV